MKRTFMTERTPPHSQTDWLINDSKEIIKENSYIYSLSSSYPFLSHPIFLNLFFQTFNKRPKIR